jgi:hypothetical protein
MEFSWYLHDDTSFIKKKKQTNKKKHGIFLVHTSFIKQNDYLLAYLSDRAHTAQEDGSPCGHCTNYSRGRQPVLLGIICNTNNNNTPS